MPRKSFREGNDRLGLLRETILEACRLSGLDHICSMVADTVLSLEPQSYVAVSLADQPGGDIRVRALAGLGALAEKVASLLGRDPTEVVISPDRMGSRSHLYTTGRLERIPGGLAALAEGTVPRTVCRAVERLGGIREVLTVGFALDSRPCGGIILFRRTLEPVEDAGLVETLASMLSLILHRRSAEMEVDRSRKLYKALVEASPEAVASTDLKGRFVFVSRKKAELMGLEDPEELIGREAFSTLLPEERARARRDMAATLEHGTHTTGEYLVRRADGSTLPVEFSASVLRDGEGAPCGFVTLTRDISRRREAEAERERLLHSVQEAQKMEALGRLAGGVAHDFNNMLGVIMGQCDLIGGAASGSAEVRRGLKRISQAAGRAREMTSQLLSFGRKQVLTPGPLSLDRLVDDLCGMTDRLVGEEIETEVRHGSSVPPISVDSAGLERALLNLIINARDAMPEGGRLTISTRRLEVSGKADPDFPDLDEGEYAAVAVRDTGTGMDRETVSRVFDPFYTTKQDSGGTGLGLAMLYGFVGQSGGTVRVESTPEEGSLFEMAFPGSDAGGEAHEHPGSEERPVQGGSETVLLAEDEASLLEVLRQLLEGLGYRVLCAADGQEAVDVSRGFEGSVDLLLTDVVMPRMDGRTAAARISASRPGIAVLFMSGYTRDLMESGLPELSRCGFIAKPFSLELLAKRIREVLGG
jgi:PAS domain S-box-containing protein